MVFVLAAFGAGMVVYAEETQNDTEDFEEYKGLGFTVKNPEGWEGLKGSLVIMPLSSTAINDNPELYGAQLCYFPLTEEEANENYGADEESALELIKKMSVAGAVFTIKGDKEILLETLKELEIVEPDEEDIQEDIIQVGEADGYQFFVLSLSDDEYAAALDEEYAEDYRNLPALLTKELKQAEYYAPVDKMNDLAGRTLSFTTTDLDGNTVTSEELFKDNEITMVNLWGVWCINCVNEMEELAAIHERLQEKGCGIIGLEWEQDPGEETYQEARDLMDEKGTNYPSVLMPEDNEILEQVTSFPATFYVNREGLIMTKPIIGARVKEYEPTLDALLTDASPSENGSDESGSYIYRVFVKDEEDHPLEKVVVQFCDDTSCRLGKTDEDGCAEFEVPEEKSYEVHIEKAPDGYAFDKDETVNTQETASDTTIILKKDEGKE